MNNQHPQPPAHPAPPQIQRPAPTVHVEPPHPAPPVVIHEAPHVEPHPSILGGILHGIGHAVEVNAEISAEQQQVELAAQAELAQQREAEVLVNAQAAMSAQATVDPLPRVTPQYPGYQYVVTLTVTEQATGNRPFSMTVPAQQPEISSAGAVTPGLAPLAAFLSRVSQGL